MLNFEGFTEKEVKNIIKAFEEQLEVIRNGGVVKWTEANPFEIEALKKHKESKKVIKDR